MNEWVSTKERLPKENRFGRSENLLFHYTWGTYQTGMLVMNRENELFWVSDLAVSKFGDVDYWMWFDEAPKGADSDE